MMKKKSQFKDVLTRASLRAFIWVLFRNSWVSLGAILGIHMAISMCCHTDGGTAHTKNKFKVSPILPCDAMLVGTTHTYIRQSFSHILRLSLGSLGALLEHLQDYFGFYLGNIFYCKVLSSRSRVQDANHPAREGCLSQSQCLSSRWFHHMGLQIKQSQILPGRPACYLRAWPNLLCFSLGCLQGWQGWFLSRSVQENQELMHQIPWILFEVSNNCT